MTRTAAVPAPATSEADVYRLHLVAPDLDSVVRLLNEQGWDLVSVELRDDDTGAHTVCVRPRDAADGCSDTVVTHVPVRASLEPSEPGSAHWP